MTTQAKPKLPTQYDFSNGSTNTYLVTARHGMIPRCIHCRRIVDTLFDGTAYYNHFVRGIGSVGESFPHLSKEHREILISGIHPECWDEMFAGDDEDDEG